MPGLTDVAGLEVGHFTDSRRPTGCTVIVARGGAVAGVDVRGAAPGTRETELLAPVNSIDTVHAVVLAGGSAFGLDAASGVMRWLEERGIGLAVPAQSNGRGVVVPIVPAAILFDLGIGDAAIRPDADAGYAACEAASSGPVVEGNVGAGAGASVGKLFGLDRAMRGGLGSAATTIDGVSVAALVAVNAVGDIVDKDGGLIAGVRDASGQRIVGAMSLLAAGELPARWRAAGGAADGAPGTATTLAVVATDAVLDKTEATKLAQMAHDGLARSIDPAHTLGDGDIVFALATGAAQRRLPLTLLGAVAASVLAEAVRRGVRAGVGLRGAGLPDLPAARDFGSTQPQQSPRSET